MRQSRSTATARSKKFYPEYESAAVIAEKSGMPVGEAGAWIVQKYKEGNKKHEIFKTTFYDQFVCTAGDCPGYVLCRLADRDRRGFPGAVWK